jgi:hypothetical protein
MYRELISEQAKPPLKLKKNSLVPFSWYLMRFVGGVFRALLCFVEHFNWSVRAFFLARRKALSASASIIKIVHQFSF